MFFGEPDKRFVKSVVLITVTLDKIELAYNRKAFNIKPHQVAGGQLFFDGAQRQEPHAVVGENKILQRFCSAQANADF